MRSGLPSFVFWVSLTDRESFRIGLATCYLRTTNKKTPGFNSVIGYAELNSSEDPAPFYGARERFVTASLMLKVDTVY